MKRPFNKPPTTHIEQVALLQSRGMIVDDIEKAAFYLKHLNYYRLGAYWLPFESDHATHKFKDGTTFNEVLSLYNFDRELRLLIIDAVERIEVSIRAHWTYFMAHNHGAHAYLDDTLIRIWRGARREDREKNEREIANYKHNLKDLDKEIRRSNELFITHYFSAYNSPELPPIWAVCEVMSLGLLSRWYNNLISGKTKRAIAGAYGLDETLMESWIHHISIVRNLCAHHQRLWNREFALTPAIPITKPKALANQFQRNSRRLYNALIILLFFMDVIAPNDKWRLRLITHLVANQEKLSHMGFPADWETRAIWAQT